MPHSSLDWRKVPNSLWAETTQVSESTILSITIPLPIKNFKVVLLTISFFSPNKTFNRKPKSESNPGSLAMTIEVSINAF